MTSIASLPAETVAAFAVFAFVASITPGPNNAMVLASGANFGFRRTIPHMLGVVVGFEVLLLAVGLGLGGLFAALTILQDILFYVGAAYLLWLAWKIAISRSLGSAEAHRPMRFLEVAAFQWVNPKAWTGAIGAVSAYAPKGAFVAGMAMIAAVFLLMTVVAMVVWTSGGLAVRRLLDRPFALRAFNICMGLILALSLLPGILKRLAA